MIEDKNKVDEYYEALLARDSQYLGSFYVGVKTTNVFCISTCRARKPKKENVVFYISSKEALQHGFRPCKVCKPTENVNETPVEVKHLMKLVEEHPDRKIKDMHIRELSYSPEKVRRWFKANMNMTFQAYQRMIRLNTAFDQLNKGGKVTHSAYDSGYESLSGFGHSFKSIFNTTPSKASHKNKINIQRFTTPLGPMYACATTKGLCLLEFTDRRMLEMEFKDLCSRLKAEIVPGNNPHLELTEKQITEYFNGTRMNFDIPLDTPGTNFQIHVWRELTKISFGTTRSYKEQAEALGNPKGVRAVASANGHNRIAIVIPCHRVIGSDGKLTGYGGGLPRKKWLLQHEKRILSISTHIEDKISTATYL